MLTVFNRKNQSIRHRAAFGSIARRLFAIGFLIGAAGCSTLSEPQRFHLASEDPALSECAEWFQVLDSAVADSAVGDIAARRIAGFPYLRTDRFLEAKRADARADATVRDAWISEMRARDRSGRAVEIANLPDVQVDKLTEGDRQAIASRTEQCATTLMSADQSDDRARSLLDAKVEVADDYSRLKRIVGLYALTRLPFYAGVSGWQKQLSKIFGEYPQDPDAQGSFEQFSPPSTPGYTPAEVAKLTGRAANSPLGMVALSNDEQDRLFATFAPVFDVETTGPFDRIGKLHWKKENHAAVDTAQPVLYRRLAYTRMEGQTLLQLTYTAWFPARPRTGPFDVLGGHLDGVVWRVTLAADGRPLLFDSIHPCGCYHLFFPTERLSPIPSPKRWIEWAFVPISNPLPDTTQSVTLILESRTHHLLGLTTTDLKGSGETYTFVEYDELRSLPLPDSGRKSLFRPDGLIGGSERGERFLFWPMGIASPGAMRQAGTQATAFVGRRHFDDADLIEKRFRLVE